MDKRIAVISIIIEDMDSVSDVNDILHTYGEHIIGRMGIPYRDKGLHIICVVIDAEESTISSVSGKLGMLRGVSTKTAIAKSK